ncbi:hypothetical protein MNBD_ALPHA06-1465, partial [hydrothermal vent metagenome]
CPVSDYGDKRGGFTSSDPGAVPGGSTTKTCFASDFDGAEIASTDG